MYWWAGSGMHWRVVVCTDRSVFLRSERVSIEVELDVRT